MKTPGTALGIKEETILAQLQDFMSRRLFGPDRLRFLRDEFARSVTSDWQDHDKELTKLEKEREQLERSLYRQTLRLEEHDDPNHPVIAAAKQRIEEISSRQIGVLEAISNLKGARPTGIRPDEIEAMLQAIPDMRPTLQSANATDLAEICEVFRITVIYDKPNRTIELSATIVPELLPNDMNPTYTEGPVGVFIYSGGGIETSTRDPREPR